MERIEVTALLSPTRRERRALELEQQRQQAAKQDITIDESDEEDFLKALEEKLQQKIDRLGECFLVLRAKQINSLAFRLHDALEPKRDVDTNMIEAWTIQPELNMKVKLSSHIQVLKLSTILREVQCLRVHHESTLRPPIEIEIFPSLKTIEILHTEVAALRNVHYFARQLRSLHIEQTEMEALGLILAPLPHDEAKPVVWKRLHMLQINCCELPAVDESVNQLEVVKTLDLGWNKIKTFQAPMTSRTIETFNLCHNKLHQVPPIQSLQMLRELDLSVNKISSLRGLEVLASLENLNVSHNQLHNIGEVELLVQLTKLRRLKMNFNPFSKRPDYRREVLFYVGEAVELDEQQWTFAEKSSMKKSRKLQNANHESTTLWGAAPIQTVSASSELAAKKDTNLVMGYHAFPLSKGITAQFAEIHNPPSILSPQYRKKPLSPLDTRASSRVWHSSHMTNDRTENEEHEDGTEDGEVAIRTVNDYFTVQHDTIIMVKNENFVTDDEVIATAERSSSISLEEIDSRSSRKYSASDFMKDFEEEELLIREGTAISGIEFQLTRATSQRGINSKITGKNLSVRVLLSANEASAHDLVFGIDGLSATLEIKRHELIETFELSYRDGPRIVRWLPDMIAIGYSIHSSRAKIITLKLRCASTMNDVTYQIDSLSTLERLLGSLIGYVHEQQKNQWTICTCANCGGISQYTREYLLHPSVESYTLGPSTDSFMVYWCLLCSSFNVREISLTKMLDLCSTEAITLSIDTRVQKLPPGNEGNGFYLEETEVDPSMAMYECVLISNLGVKEAVIPSDQWDDHNSKDMHSDAWNDAIVEAITK